jgi:LPS O-antigen subunit length determinant protein (WzzB/FepE family)
MENTPPVTTQSDEIDLLELLLKGVLVIRRNFAMIIIFFLAGTALGLIYNQISPNVYSSKMLINSDILTESYSKQLMNTLNTLIKERDTQILSEKLGMDQKKVSKINSVLIESALVRTENIAENSKNYLTVEVLIGDNSILPQLQDALINYLRSNEFVKIRVEQKRKYTNQVIEKIDLELIDLEKLKVKITEGGLAQSTKDNIVLFDPTTINSKILELNKEKINLQNSLETINSIQLIEGFTAFNKPISPKLSLSMVAGSAIGLIFAALFVAYKAIRAMLRFSEAKNGKS